MALPSPCKQCWNEETLSGQVKVYRAAQTSTLFGGEEGGGGKGEKERHIVFIVIRRLSPIVAFVAENALGEKGTSI